MNNSSQNPKGDRSGSRSKKEKSKRKKVIQKADASFSKAAFKTAKIQDGETTTKSEQNSMRLKKESEGKFFGPENSFQAKEPVGNKEKRPSNPKTNNNNILINKQKEIRKQYLNHKRKRPLQRKAHEKKKDAKPIDEVAIIPSTNEPEGQYALRKRKTNEHLDFSLINCHQCQQIGMMNQMLTCRNERCRDSYCFKCIQNYYIKNASKLNLLTMRLGSWKCFKCKNECKCEYCLMTKTVVPQQKIAISIEPQKRTKRKIIRKTKRIQPKKAKAKPKLKQNIIEINGMTIIETKETKQNANEIHSGNNNNGQLLLSQEKLKTILDDKPNGKPCISLHLNKKEKHLMRISKMVERVNIERNKNLKRECLLCSSYSLQVNEALLFLTANEFFDYMSYLFSFKISAICYNEYVFQENVHDIAKYRKKTLNKKQWQFHPQIICKGCVIIKLNQPKCLGYFLDRIIQTKENISNINPSNVSSLLTDHKQKSESAQNKSAKLLANLHKKDIEDNNNNINGNFAINNNKESIFFDHIFNKATCDDNSNRDDIAHNPSRLLNDENSNSISRNDVGVFINYNGCLHESVQDLNLLITHLNQDLNSNSLTLDKISEYANIGNRVYQSYYLISFSYSQNQSIFLNKVNKLIESISHHSLLFEDIQAKILETKTNFENISINYIKLLKYIDNSVQWFMGRLNFHYQYLSNKSKENQHPANNTN